MNLREVYEANRRIWESLPQWVRDYAIAADEELKKKQEIEWANRYRTSCPWGW